MTPIARAISCALALTGAFAAETTANDLIDVQRANQRLFKTAVERIKPYLVRIDTIGGVIPRGDGVEITPDESGDVDADGDGTPDKPTPKAFRETLGDKFLVADGPTTGIIYDSDGWILSSSFNFIREPAYITVHLPDGRKFVADLVARDKVRKLALLKIDAHDLEVPQWVPTSDMQIGQWAIALGRGFGGDMPSVTVGIVSALNRMTGNAVQTDAKLGPPNYGGPLIDIQGRVLGICVPMAQRQGELAGVQFYDAGVGFAVPEHRVREIVSTLQTGTSIYRGWLGIQVALKPKDGLLIRGVGNPSPTRAAGITPGSFITEANGIDIRSFTHLRQAIYMVPAGEAVQLIVRRGKFESGYEITLARNEDLGNLVRESPPVIDPDDPFPLPKPNTWP